jgi:hypothetical protein
MSASPHLIDNGGQPILFSTAGGTRRAKAVRRSAFSIPIATES